jgi:hypothetical protein
VLYGGIVPNANIPNRLSLVYPAIRQLKTHRKQYRYGNAGPRNLACLRIADVKSEGFQTGVALGKVNHAKKRKVSIAL